MRLFVLQSGILATSLTLGTVPAVAQYGAIPATPSPVTFKSGTGNSGAIAPLYVKPPRPEIDCAALDNALQAIFGRYYPSEFSPGAAPPRRLLDEHVFDKALAGYRAYYCSYGRNIGPAQIVVVDFAKHSSEPRMYRIDLRSGDGIDRPIVVAHGVGSDPNDDGFADFFSNVHNSLTSSLGAARGGEIYSGTNGISLRLDGLEPSNSQMRARDIVVHSYSPERRRYFNASVIMARGGKPGASEGCFVIEPDKRDWILDTLANGGYLYSGYSGVLPQPKLSEPVRTVIFTRGTGPISSAPAALALEKPDETNGNLPKAPISPAPAILPQ